MRTLLTPDREMSRRFIEALTGDKQTPVTWQYFQDNKEETQAKRIKQAGHPHGDYRTHYRVLEKKQADGCGIYIMVNAGDGQGRKAENVVEVRSLFIDLDGAPMEPVVRLLKPHIIVESSPGRYHLYWKVADCQLDQFTALQRAIAVKFNGDKSCVDLCRVLRVPGFWHLKGEPYMTRLLEVNDHSKYSVEEIVTGLGLETASSTPLQRQASTTPMQLQQTSSIATADTHQSSSTEIVIPETGEAIDLKKWAARHTDFDLLAALNQNAPHILRGALQDGKQHIQCPFESEHTDQAADYATFAANKGNGYASWEIHCLHSHCADRDRLHFLAAMFDKGWLPYDLLTDSTPDAQPDRRRPPKVYLPHIELATDLSWTALQPDELRIALHLFLLSCREDNGLLPDDNWMLARHLGIDEPVWIRYRTTLERIGWLQGDGVHLWNKRAAREVVVATKAYNDKIAAGKKRHSKDSTPTPGIV
jgi:hypothetical protein